MNDIKFLKTLRKICEKRCNVDFDELGKELTPEYEHCPFPWRFCDLDVDFYEMSDEQLEEICEKVRRCKDVET